MVAKVVGHFALPLVACHLLEGNWTWWQYLRKLNDARFRQGRRQNFSYWWKTYLLGLAAKHCALLCWFVPRIRIWIDVGCLQCSSFVFGLMLTGTNPWKGNTCTKFGRTKRWPCEISNLSRFALVRWSYGVVLYEIFTVGKSWLIWYKLHIKQIWLNLHANKIDNGKMSCDSGNKVLHS